MNYYDQTFGPWKIQDGQVVVADEVEWAKLAELQRVVFDYPKCPHCKYFEFTNSVDCGVATHVCHDCQSETPESEWYIRPVVKLSLIHI